MNTELHEVTHALITAAKHILNDCGLVFLQIGGNLGGILFNKFYSQRSQIKCFFSRNMLEKSKFNRFWTNYYYFFDFSDVFPLRRSFLRKNTSVLKWRCFQPWNCEVAGSKYQVKSALIVFFIQKSCSLLRRRHICCFLSAVNAN